MVLVFLFFVVRGMSQPEDRVVMAEGKIINGETNAPIPAKITYQSLPYGNTIGVVNNSVYSFPILNGDHYSIVVEAEGFLPAKYLLDPKEANAENKLIFDIILSTGQPKKEHVAGEVLRLDNLIFEVGKDRIDQTSYAELDILALMMKENPAMEIQLEGHTDYVGNARDNMRLSEQRVEAVRQYLVSKGIARHRIFTKAYGGTQPLSRDDTPEAHRMNRRVELRILKN